MKKPTTFIVFKAQAYQWDQEEYRSYNITLPKVLKKAQKFNEPAYSAEYIFKTKVVTEWDGDRITMLIPVKDGSIKNIESDIDSLANSFQDGASDGYLEGDAVIHTSKGHDYEFVLNDITMEVVQGNQVVKKYDFGSYW
jgi:hypothetical protein